MSRKGLLLASIGGSGTQFLMKLLSSHDLISEFVDVAGIHSRSFLVIPGGVDFIETELELFTELYMVRDDLFQKLLQLHAGDYAYTLLFRHITNPWVRWVVALQPFALKVVAPARHPFYVLRTLCRRHAEGWGKDRTFREMDYKISTYFDLLSCLRANDDYTLIPVDLLGQASEAERVLKIRQLFESFLGLTFTSSVEKMVCNWPSVTAYPDYVIPEVYLKRIEFVLENSGILEALRRFGIDYSSIDML